MALCYKDYYEYSIKLINKYNVSFLENRNEFMLHNDFIKEKKIAEKFSFTPYIYNECSANCRFCSEKLERKRNVRSNTFEVCENYFSKLEFILSKFKNHKLFLSISGIEPLESLGFLKRVLCSVQKFEEQGGQVYEKVIYSNLSAGTYNLEEIVKLINDYNISRIETSRHHYNEEKNNNIVRFKNKDILLNKNYEYVVGALRKIISIKLVCVLQKNGIDSFEEVENYLKWANKIGIKNVIFRELSIFKDSIMDNESSNYIRENRVSLMDILDNIDENKFKLKEIYKGYYYFSFRYVYNGKTEVTFEVSDYEEMIKCHRGNEIHKLIYYPNGNLCCDWNMENKVF